LIDERLEIAYVQGNVGPFLRLPQGEAGLNILGMVREPLRIELRSIVHKATREARFVRSHPIKFEEGGKHREVRLQAGPAGTEKGQELTLVVFEQRPVTPSPLEAPSEGGKAEAPRVVELERELATLREHLKTTMEELETANEELQSLNEELQSANEELQSSNEELETSNEELQSTNEELTRVNEELRVKTNELASTTIDLENILKQTDIAMVIVDRHLKVTRFTPSATIFFQLTPPDIGQFLPRVPAAPPQGDLLGMLMGALEEASPRDFDFTLDSRHYSLRIRPYLGEIGQVVGAILLFIDRTDTLEWECALDHSRLCQLAIVDGVDNGIIIVGEQGHIETYNPAAERIFDLPASAVIGKNIRVLQPSTIDWDPNGDLSMLFDSGRTECPHRSVTLCIAGRDGRRQRVAVSISVIRLDKKEKVLGIIRTPAAGSTAP
jgi:two-component system CheB/CheR fusion protein